MSKAIKFKNNTYLDSSSITHNKTTLQSIINTYKSVARKNNSLNEKYTRKYNTATILSLISIFMLVGIYIFSFFVR